MNIGGGKEKKKKNHFQLCLFGKKGRKDRWMGGGRGGKGKHESALLRGENASTTCKKRKEGGSRGGGSNVGK